MLTVITCVVCLLIGGLLGWKLTASRERMLGYAEAVEDQFKRIRSSSVGHVSSSLRILKGGKR